MHCVAIFSQIVGLLGDSYIQRYKILQSPFCIRLVNIIIMAIDVISMSATVHYLMIIGLALSARAVCATCMYQLVGASGEELNFSNMIYWTIWAWSIHNSIQDLLTC